MSLPASPARITRLLLPAFAAALTLAVSAPGASAFGPVDQQQPVQDGSITMLPGLAQTFTVGRSGKLDGFTLWPLTTGQIAFQFYPLRADGAPEYTKPLLAGNGGAQMIAGTATTLGFMPIDVKAGDRLALALGTVRSTQQATFATGAGDPYAAGTLFQVTGAFVFTAFPADLTFASHVTAPEPTQLRMPALSSTNGRATAVLTWGSDQQPLAGKVVAFRLLRSNGAVKDTCSATTTASGVATCSKRWSIASGGSATASFAGDTSYLPSSASITS